VTLFSAFRSQRASGPEEQPTGPDGPAPEPDARADGPSDADRPVEVGWVRPVDPPWTRPALAALLVGTAIAYLWNLSINGWSNSFYAAAVQAGTMNWKAFFFGSFDPANYITVDKPPVSLWIMALSGRIFGFNSWSMLAPEALLGVASVALLYLTVRRVWGAPAGLLAGLALAVTPVATLMFRYNNPDAALTFFMVAAAYTMTRALEQAGTRWLLATGALIGVAFLTKELQALLVVPGLALAYLVTAPTGLGRRVWQLLLTGATMAVSGLWWLVLVDLLPASSRPYVGGSTDNSALALALGYNGLGRLTGDEAGGFGGGGMPRGVELPAGVELPGGGELPRGGPGGGGMFSGSAGVGRLFNAEFGGFVAWLIPAAILGVVVVAWFTRRAVRSDPRRGSLILWTGWFVVTAAVFSFSKGIIHTYYGIALAPAVGALAAMALPTLWRARASAAARIALAGFSAGTAGTAFVLLDRASDWWPWLRWAVLGAGLLAAIGLVAIGLLSAGRVSAGPRSHRVAARALVACATLGLVGAVAGPAAWSAATIGTSHTGGVPSVGPAQAQAGGFGRGGGFPGGGQLPPGLELPGGGQGLPGGNETVDAALVTMLRTGSDDYTWAAATTSSNSAAPLQLSSGRAVMSLGGFSGSDPAITLDPFKRYVADHRVHYYVSGGGFGGGFGRGGAENARGGRTTGVSAIETWVASAYTATTVGSYTVYDLSAPKS